MSVCRNCIRGWSGRHRISGAWASIPIAVGAGIANGKTGGGDN
jgi:hypothetical protein